MLRFRALSLVAGLAVASALALPGGAGAATLVPLTRNAHVMDSLVAARMADRIRHECPTISGRLIRAWFKAEELKRWALDQGYTEAQIKAFLRDPKAKALVEARAEEGLRRQGARPGDAQSFCAAGQAEIDAKTLAGSLLYVN